LGLQDIYLPSGVHTAWIRFSTSPFKGYTKQRKLVFLPAARPSNVFRKGEEVLIGATVRDLELHDRRAGG